MRVMYITPGLSAGGGAERSLASLVPHWRDIELNIVTFTPANALAAEIGESGATVTALTPSSRSDTVTALRKSIADWQPDLVHSTLFDADIAARLATPLGVPLSATWAGLNYGRLHRQMPGRTSWKVMAAQALDASTARRVGRFHAVSEEIATLMSRRLLIPRRQVEVIPRGRSRSQIGYATKARRERIRRDLGIDSGPLVLAVARQEWVKGLDVLVRSIPHIESRLPDANIKIAGPPGLQTRPLLELCQKMGVTPQSVFLGQRDDAVDLLSAADVVCIPSRSEGCSNVMIESMALGTPTLASDIPALRGLDPEADWATFFPAEDERALATGVADLVADSGPTRRARGIERFEANYDNAPIASRMLNFFSGASGQADSSWETP